MVLAALAGERFEGGGDEGALGGGVAPELDLVDSPHLPLDAGQDAVHPGVGDGALLDREQASSAPVDEAGIAELAPGGEAHVVAVAPGVIGADDGIHGRVGEPADTGELLADDALLGGELGGVLEVLELAAAALPEERALWLGACTRGFEDVGDHTLDVVGVDALDLDLDQLAGGGEGGHERLAVGKAGEAAAARHDALDANGLEAFLLGDLLPAAATAGHAASVDAAGERGERR